ncbi:uncharacterized protein LOC129584113 [Paramacrobiotus metropolitanus]|uniref:uncharacterized protein LOC129584113 n=1 Tax=Paramacrobiotus metropolitanus TaxID=2943436 RepID=UPI002445ED88|nr:uncharacterized protein LOC129584113 [Paramacrobiotus metropolitanus]
MPKMSLRSSTRAAARVAPPVAVSAAAAGSAPVAVIIEQSPQSPPPSAANIAGDPEPSLGLPQDISAAVLEEAFWCDKCVKYLDEPCWEHAAPLKDQNVDLATSTLPDSLVVEQREGMTEKGIFATCDVPRQTLFGPLEAPIGDEPSCFAVPDEESGVKYYQLSSDEGVNWMKFVRFAEGKHDQNLSVFLRGAQIFFVSVKDIAAQEELRVWYSKKYMDSVGHLLTALPHTVAVVEADDDVTMESTEEDEVSEEETMDEEAVQEPEAEDDNGYGERVTNTEMVTESTDPDYISKKPPVIIQRIIRANRPKFPSRLATGPYTPKIERVIMKKTPHLLLQLSPMPPPKPRSNGRPTRHPYPFGCADCGLHFRLDELLQLHLMAHVAEEDRLEMDQYHCPQCGITRKNLTNIIKHVKSHSRTAEQLESRKKECPYCGREFVNLQKHLETNHKDKIIITVEGDEADECRCKECGFQARTKQAITNHLKKHLEPEKNIRRCVICQDTFPFTPVGATDLQKHVETHIVDDLFPCAECPKRYTTYRGLTDHFGTNHDPSQKCACEICQREFMTRWRLKRHMLSHSNIFNFMCELCGKQFKSKGQLQKHNKYVHIGLKRIRPSEKGLKKNYKERLRQAYDYSPFKCHECKLGYRQRGMLLNHVMARHPETSLDTIPDHFSYRQKVTICSLSSRQRCRIIANVQWYSVGFLTLRSELFPFGQPWRAVMESESGFESALLPATEVSLTLDADSGLAPVDDGQSTAALLNEFLKGFPQVATNEPNLPKSVENASAGIWCDGCGRLVEEPCWEHASAVEDDVVDLSTATLPPCLVIIRKEDSQEIGVFARAPIAMQCRFGPVVAPVNSHFSEETTLALPFPELGKKNAVYFDMADDRRCNWLKHVRFTHNAAEQNLAVYLYQGGVYFVSVKAVAAGCELKAAYSPQYAALLTKKFLDVRGFHTGPDAADHRPSAALSKILPVNYYMQSEAGRSRASVDQMEDADTSQKPDSGESMEEAPTGRYSLRRRKPSHRSNSPVGRSEKVVSSVVDDERESGTKDQESHHDDEAQKEPESEPEYTPKPTASGSPKKPGRKRNASTGRVEHVKVKKTAALLQNIPKAPQRKPRTAKLDMPSFLFKFKHSCKECGLHFRSAELLQLHNLLHLPEEQRGGDVERKCPKCGIVRRNAEIMVKHVRQHARTTDQLDPERQKCPFCHKYYVHLRSHLDLTHREQYRQGPDLDETGLKYQCDVCQLRFRTIHGLKSHSQTHVENGPKLSQCLICNEYFKYSELQKHTESHVVEERFPCPSCTGTYPTYKSLTRHVQAAHDPSKVLICHLCQKVYVTRSRLNRHMLSHSNTFAFICDHCGKQFKIKQQMQRHIERVHLKINTEKLKAAERGEDPKDKDANKAPYLRPRLRMAFEEFPYKCQECSLGYLQRGKLVNHILMRHPEMNLDDIPA